MTQAIPRRRFITIAGAAAGLHLLPSTARASQPVPVTWRGTALGASAALQIHHPDPDVAARLIGLAVAEVRRLEGIFSLYRQDSWLGRLNRTGVLVAPPRELTDLLGRCREYAELTGGAFDPTVQPLWTLYRDHFSQPGADPAGPSHAAVDAAREKIGIGQVAISRDRISFGRPGMGLTLNGIAQGFVTDRVVDLLRSQGISRTLVDLGESRAVGLKPDGEPWRVALQASDEPRKDDTVVDLTDRAVATSGPYGFRFDPEGRFHHLFDPRAGTCASRFRSVSVLMPTATTADALSTAFSVLTQPEIARILRSVGTGEVHLTTEAGKRETVRS